MMRRQLIYPILAFLSLPVLIWGQQKLQQLLSLAAPKPANIVIETKNVLGPVNRNWPAFAQGGEEPPPMLSKVVDKVKQLSPKFIRIDHIYDSYSVVEKTENGFRYDFSRLDKTIDDIIATGALPFLTLSYMPSVFTLSGSIIDNPVDWNNWRDLVKATVEHYSGKNNRNLTDVYYEVWNEPELPQFGGWGLSGEKDYRLLYFYAVAGANQALNVNEYFIGGPSVGSYYSHWVNNFLSYISQNNLRLDFYSWHRYTKKPHEYVNDSQKIRKLLSDFPKYADIPLILSEWGIESDNNNINNTNIAASYTIFSLARFYQDINLAFAFEVKDGPPPSGGKWGLLTHENDASPLSAKPKFKAFELLNKISGDQIQLSGEGTYVAGLASLSSQNIHVILGNYDMKGENIENVPITFTGLTPGSYRLSYSYPLDDKTGFYEIISTNGIINKNFLMPANTILYLELTKTSPLANFISSYTDHPRNRALVLLGSEDRLVFTYPEFRLLPSGSISFAIKPFWDKNDRRSFFIFEAPFSPEKRENFKMYLAKNKTIEGNILKFAIFDGKNEYSISQPIDHWQKDSWHHIEVGWEINNIWLSIDNFKLKKDVSIDIRNGKILSFSPIEAAIDNVKIVVGGQQIIERKFDGRVDN